MSLEKSSPPYGTQPYPKALLDIYRSIRLVTELRLARATTIDDANRVLDDFLPRFNERFGVPSRHAETAYRLLEPGMCLDTVLCLKYRRRVGRDNTVKYRWRTLQLLPDRGRPSYAGSVVDVLEGLDGQLAVRYQGEIIPSQEAPPRPGILRSFKGSSSHGPPPHGGLNGLGRRWEAALAALDAEMDAGDADDTAVDNGTVRVRKAPAMQRRKPTPLQSGKAANPKQTGTLPSFEAGCYYSYQPDPNSSPSCRTIQVCF